MKVAVEGCLHGQLETVYRILTERERNEGIKIDLLLCCGDFQAVRNRADLEMMSVPDKYKEMGSFYKYYSGQLKAPILTVFVGGNHEASNHLLELAYGGWVAPNIYYLGYSGVVFFGGLRIAGVSGIYNEYHYELGHYERLPFSRNMIKSAYHTREFEVFKLKQLTGQIDIFMSHDWPLEIYYHGNLQQLLRIKPYFEKEIRSRTLGSPAGKELMDHLKPKYWFAGHLHVKFEATYLHRENTRSSEDPPATSKDPLTTSKDPLTTSKDPPTTSEDPPATSRDPPATSKDPLTTSKDPLCTPSNSQPESTYFLALDKCLPKRMFLKVLDFPDQGSPKILSYDPQWLALTKAINGDIPIAKSPWQPSSGSRRTSFTPTEDELKWIFDKFQGNFTIPQNFIMTVAPFDPSNPWQGEETVTKVDHPQTVEFCTRLEICNPFGFNPGLYKPLPQATSTLETPFQANPDEISLDDLDNQEDESDVEFEEEEPKGKRSKSSESSDV